MENNFSINKLKDLYADDNIKQCKQYIKQYFCPLTNGNHIMFGDNIEIITNDVMERVYLNRFPKMLREWYECDMDVRPLKYFISNNKNDKLIDENRRLKKENETLRDDITYYVNRCTEYEELINELENELETKNNNDSDTDSVNSDDDELGNKITDVKSGITYEICKEQIELDDMDFFN